MAVPTKQTELDAQSAAGRRSTRLAIAIPITMAGKDSAGHSFKENTRTSIINRHGAKLATFHQLTLGAEIQIENRALGSSARGNVVWLGDKRSPKDPIEIGVQLIEAGNIWGIEFPPEDWQEGPPVGFGGQRLSKAAAPAPAAKPAEAAPPPPPQPKPARAPSPPAAKPPAPSQPQAVETAKPVAAGAAVSPPAPAITVEQAGPPLEEALARFSHQADEMVEARAKIFDERLAKLTTQVGIQTQSTLQDAARSLEEKMVLSLEQKLGSLADRLQASRSEIEVLLAKFQQLQQSCQAEVDKTKRNIEEASFASLQSAVEQLNERLQKELEATREDFIAQTRKRVEEQASQSIEMFSKEASTRLAKLAEEYLAQAGPELQARQAQATDQAKAQISQVIQSATTTGLEELQHKSEALVGDFQAQLEKAVRKTQEKSAKEATEYLQKTVEGLLATSAKELQRQVGEGKSALKDELKTSSKALAEDAKKQLAAMTTSTVDCLNKEAKAGLEEFRSHLRKSAEDMQEKGGRDLESQLQKMAEKQGEDLLKRLQKEADDSCERAIAQIKSKTDQSVKEASDTVNKHVGSGAVFLRELEEQAREHIETHSQKIEASAKTSAQAFEKQMGDLAATSLDKLHRESDALVEDFRARLQEASRGGQAKSVEELHVRMQNITDKLVEDSAALLTKQSEESLELVAAKLEEKREKVLNEAEEALRTKLAEAFSAVLQPGSKKNAEREPEETKKRR